ncbi:MAG: hypothetical protein V2I27_12850 [Erythrobacter sp.]|nr:hypothetical protein [Erythrobacter sp.]
MLAALVVWFIVRNSRRTDVIRDEHSGTARDVLDEGASRAQRNQALIDAPQAVEKVFGETSANANSQGVAAAPADADAEAGASVTPTRTLATPAPAPSPAATPKSAATSAPAAQAPRAPVSPPPAAGAGAAGAAGAGAGAGAGADDLTRIKGVGPKLVAVLAELGITRFEQIAHWNAADIERVDAQLGRFRGRIERDQWVEQAKLLMQGDKSEFEAKFGKQ